MKRNIFCGLFLSAMLLAVHNLDAATRKTEKKNLRPQVAVIQKDGKKQLRRCFRDADKNGFCDRGTDQKGKCKNNCRKAESADKKSLQTTPSPAASAPGTAKTPEMPQPQIRDNNSKGNTVSKNSPCTGCPFAGNCSNGCLAMLKKNSTNALI